MAMNNFRKAAAVKKYGPMSQTLNADQLKAIIGADDKNYGPEEIEEIQAAIQAGDTGATEAGEGNPEDQEAGKEAEDLDNSSRLVENPKTLNKVYEEYNVDLQYKTIRNEWTGEEKRVLKDGEGAYEKVGRAIRITSVHPETAELLNSQSHNTKRRLYLKK